MYTKLKKDGVPFEIIFASSDKNELEFKLVLSFSSCVSRRSARGKGCRVINNLEYMYIPPCIVCAVEFVVKCIIMDKITSLRLLRSYCSIHCISAYQLRSIYNDDTVIKIDTGKIVEIITILSSLSRLTRKWRAHMWSKWRLSYTSLFEYVAELCSCVVRLVAACSDFSSRACSALVPYSTPIIWGPSLITLIEVYAVSTQCPLS